MEKSKKKLVTKLAGIKIFDLLFTFVTKNMLSIAYGMVLANIVFVYGMSVSNEIKNGVSVVNVVVFVGLLSNLLYSFVKGIVNSRTLVVWFKLVLIISYAVSLSILLKTPKLLDSSANQLLDFTLLSASFCLVYLIWKKVYPYFISRLILNRESLGMDLKCGEENIGLTKFGECVNDSFISYDLVQLIQDVTIKDEYKEIVFISDFRKHERVISGLVTEVETKEVELAKLDHLNFYGIQYSVRAFKGFYFDILKIGDCHPMWNDGYVYAKPVDEPTIGLLGNN